MNWASQKKIIETYTQLELDKTNPIMSALINEQSLNGFFHKEDERVILGPFPREGILEADINTILQRLFLDSGFLCYSMGQVGCTTAYDLASRKYELDQGGAPGWIQQTTAQPAQGGKVWYRRFGTCKNYAPRISPVPFNVFKGEDQYIYLRDGCIVAVYISACIFNGANLRTVRILRVEPVTETTSKASMQFGALYTDTADLNLITMRAQGVRSQTFTECSSANGTWLWGEHASHYLQNPAQFQNHAGVQGVQIPAGVQIPGVQIPVNPGYQSPTAYHNPVVYQNPVGYQNPVAYQNPVGYQNQIPAGVQNPVGVQNFA